MDYEAKKTSTYNPLMSCDHIDSVYIYIYILCMGMYGLVIYGLYE